MLGYDEWNLSPRAVLKKSGGVISIRRSLATFRNPLFDPPGGRAEVVGLRRMEITSRGMETGVPRFEITSRGMEIRVPQRLFKRGRWGSTKMFRDLVPGFDAAQSGVQGWGLELMR